MIRIPMIRIFCHLISKTLDCILTELRFAVAVIELVGDEIRRWHLVAAAFAEGPHFDAVVFVGFVEWTEAKVL